MTQHNIPRETFLGLSRLSLFFALSRTPHALLDMATPCLAALIWLGTFPPLRTVLLGLLTVFGGYSAVYALNDVIDYRPDRERIRLGAFPGNDKYLDGLIVRHPLAQGTLKLGESMAWIVGWALIALGGAYLLNPICVLIFVGGCFLEAMYCLMWRTSWLRSIVSGVVKTSGALAAVFAVDPQPSPAFLVLLFLWLFFWEIGGQNIPADWTDMEVNRILKARTIPVQFGPDVSARFVLVCTVMTLVMNAFLLLRKPFLPAWFSLGASFLVGVFLLLVPALNVYRTRERPQVMRLFNRASYYPMALLILFALIRLVGTGGNMWTK
jgi:4-hydroxybenzoate polyprenyltransferase